MFQKNLGKKKKTFLFFFYRIPQPLKRGGNAGNSNDSKVKRAIALFFYVQHPQPLRRGFGLCWLPIRIVPLLFGSAFVLYGFQGVCSCVAYLITRKCFGRRQVILSVPHLTTKVNRLSRHKSLRLLFHGSVGLF